MFSPQQRQVVRLVVGGLTNQEIADELSISVRTVKRRLRETTLRHGGKTRLAVALHYLRNCFTAEQREELCADFVDVQSFRLAAKRFEPADWGVLDAVLSFPEMSVEQVAGRLQITPQSMRKRLTKLGRRCGFRGSPTLRLAVCHELLLGRIRRGPAKVVGGLTQLERRLLRACAYGEGGLLAAARLKTNPNMIVKRFGPICQKLGVESREAATMRYIAEMPRREALYAWYYRTEEAKRLRAGVSELAPRQKVMFDLVTEHPDWSYEYLGITFQALSREYVRRHMVQMVRGWDIPLTGRDYQLRLGLAVRWYMIRAHEMKLATTAGHIDEEGGERSEREIHSSVA